MRPIFRNSRLQLDFESDGYVVMDLLSAEDLDSLSRLHVSDGRDAQPRDTYDITVMYSDLAYRTRVCLGIRDIFQPHLDAFLDRAKAVTGNFFRKLPSDPQSAVHLHQDWSFVDESQHYSMNVWCPLSNCDQRSGGLSVVPGSHRLNDQPRGFSEEFPFPQVESLLRDRYSLHLDVKAGQAVCFDRRLFHWSRPNLSPKERVAVNCLAVPAEAPLLYPFVDTANPRPAVELFEADEEFFWTFRFRERPEGRRLLAVVEPEPTALTPESIKQLVEHSPPDQA